MTNCNCFINCQCFASSRCKLFPEWVEEIINRLYKEIDAVNLKGKVEPYDDAQALFIAENTPFIIWLEYHEESKKYYLEIELAEDNFLIPNQSACIDITKDMRYEPIYGMEPLLKICWAARKMAKQLKQSQEQMRQLLKEG